MSSPQCRTVVSAMRQSVWIGCIAALLVSTALLAHLAPGDFAHWVLAPAMWITASCAVFGISYTVLATLLVRRFFARSVIEATAFPAVTIVKPLHGAELALMQNLVSFCQQDYPGPMQFLFGVHDSSDPALDVVRRVRAVSRGGHHGRGRCSPVWPEPQDEQYPQHAARGAVTICSCSPTAMWRSRPDYLRDVIGELQNPASAS